MALENLPAIPSVLDEPPKLSYWTVQELSYFIGVFAGVWMLSSMWLGFGLAILLVTVIRTLTSSDYGDLTKVGRYWLLPSKSQIKYLTRGNYPGLPPSHIRVLLG